MKKFFLSALILLGIINNGMSQLSSMLDPGLNFKNISVLKNSTLNVVLNKNDTVNYNPAIKYAIEKYWTFCKYKFISMDEFQETMGDKTMIFLLPNRYTYNCGVDELAIINGGNHSLHCKVYNIFYLNLNTKTAVIRLPYESAKEFYALSKNGKKKYHNGFSDSYFIANKKDCREMLINIIQLWQWENETIINHPEFADMKRTEIDDFLVSQHDVRELKTKTLYVAENSFDVLIENAISTIYKYKFEIVPMDSIYKAIKNQDENICYLYNGGRRRDCTFSINVYEANGGYRIFSPEPPNGTSISGIAKYSEDYFTDLMKAIDK